MDGGSVVEGPGERAWRRVSRRRGKRAASVRSTAAGELLWLVCFWVGVVG